VAIMLSAINIPTNGMTIIFNKNAPVEKELK